MRATLAQFDEEKAAILDAVERREEEARARRACEIALRLETY